MLRRLCPRCTRLAESSEHARPAFQVVRSMKLLAIKAERLDFLQSCTRSHGTILHYVDVGVSLVLYNIAELPQNLQRT